jgi:predicted Zn finger-like uncharacterized protein
MNVTCPQCTSVFRVDPAKVPGGGVRARCSVCSGVINVPEPSPEETVQVGGAGPASPAPDWGRSATPAGGWSPPPAPEQALPPIPLTPPGAAPTPVVGWDSPAGSATQADWGDWPHTASPFDSAHEVPPASRPLGEASQGFGQMANPLTPQMPTPPGPSAVRRSRPTLPATPPQPTYAAPATPPQPTYAAPATPPQPSYAARGTPPRPTPPTPPQAAASLTPPGALTPEQPSRSATPPAPQSGGIAMPTPPVAGRPIQTPPAPGAHINPYLRRDPHERAQRLSRALVSDIVTYYPEKHAEGVRDGTLTELFRDEIKKSYDDYVTQVGPELAQSTTYFQDALNEVLGGGKRLF